MVAGGVEGCSQRGEVAFDCMQCVTAALVFVAEVSLDRGKDKGMLMRKAYD